MFKHILHDITQIFKKGNLYNIFYESNLDEKFFFLEICVISYDILLHMFHIFKYNNYMTYDKSVI